MRKEVVSELRGKLMTVSPKILLSWEMNMGGHGTLIGLSGVSGKTMTVDHGDGKIFS